MSSSQAAASAPTVQTLLQSFVQSPGLPFADVLTATDWERLFTKHGLPTETASDAGTPAYADNSTPLSSAPATAAASELDSATTVGQPTAPPPTPTTQATAVPCPLWTPVLTLWTFLHQVVSTSKSCTAAVLRAVVLLSGLGRAPCSENPGAYSKARGRLPLGLLQDLTELVGVRLDAACPDSWRWLGQRVLVADGWIITLPDTPENQQAYPQPKTQKKGLGFPQVRLVGLFSRACNVVVGVKWGPCHGKRTGETALLRDIFDQLRPGDVLVADRYYCSYFMIALLQQRGVQVVFHLHQRRRHVFGNGQRLGAEDELVTWEKPKQCPEWEIGDTVRKILQRNRLRGYSSSVLQNGGKDSVNTDGSSIVKKVVAVGGLICYHNQVDTNVQ
jgi:hypothetical protein